jgi:hypothetical protein
MYSYKLNDVCVTYRNHNTYNFVITISFAMYNLMYEMNM